MAGSIAGKLVQYPSRDKKVGMMARLRRILLKPAAVFRSTRNCQAGRVSPLVAGGAACLLILLRFSEVLTTNYPRPIQYGEPPGIPIFVTDGYISWLVCSCCSLFFR
ncbi:hypothetical protein J3E69DRAFT_51938 [Trichoderma sp. SZMC 28015]